ncbi:hypothetical protein Y1Q_0021620 [Alligator mississippiensis]|uniref:Uncharacterized protein n=1 Tax=Alligator mississippiensis TaxID=8496 RepID=A0A151PAH2_ALLMI|nr:hypothetical protein Y1Q_0021620 [Alligator mississippiensis]
MGKREEKKASEANHVANKGYATLKYCARFFVRLAGICRRELYHSMFLCFAIQEMSLKRHQIVLKICHKFLFSEFPQEPLVKEGS